MTFFTSLKIPDYFFSWGEKKKENQYATYNFNVVFKKKLNKVKW